MISLIEPTGGKEKSGMTKTQLNKIARAWTSPRPSDGKLILDIVTERLDEDEQIVHYPGLEEAIIGVVERCGMDQVLCYSRQRIVKILMLRDGMDEDDAEEYIDFNIAGGSPGPRTPVLLS